MNSVNVMKSIGPGYIADSAMYNPNVYCALESMLADIHAEFATKRDTFEKRWLGIRPEFSPHQMRDGYVCEEIDEFPIELRELRRAKWVKLENCVYTRNDGIIFYDDKHIDAGWNYVLVSHEADLDLHSVFDLLDYRYVNTHLVEDILRNHDEEIMAGVNRLPIPSCERQVVQLHSQIEDAPNPEYAWMDEILEERSAREEEDDDAEKDRNTFDDMHMCKHVSRNAWMDEILEERSAREEEANHLEKDWRTFGCAIPWEHEPFDEIL